MSEDDKLDKLMALVEGGFARVDKRLELIETNVELQGGHMQEQGKRMTLFDERLSRLEDRQTSHSIRVKQESDVNLTQDAAIAMLHEKVDKLTGIGEQLLKVAGNPTVRRIGQGLALALLGWLASKGYLHQ